MTVEIYKYCTGCKQHRLIQEFAWNRSRPDLRSGWCKPCHRSDGAVRRQDAAYKALHKTLAKAWRQSPEGRERTRLRAARERQQYPEKIIARRRVRDALASGRLIRLPCFCGETKTEGHHEDYSKPLEVIWLCKQHHTDLRKKS